MIAQVIAKHDLRVPVTPIRPGLYLIGPNRVNVDCKFEQAMVKVGAGAEKLEPYLLKNEMPSRKKLIDLMYKSGKDLKYIVGQLKEGKQIKQAEFKDLVVKRQASGTLFSVADTESVAYSRHSRMSKKHDKSDQQLYSASHISRSSISPPSKAATKNMNNTRIRQFDTINMSGANFSPTSSHVKKDSFISANQSFNLSQSMNPHGGSSFKNPKTKGIRIYPNDS